MIIEDFDYPWFLSGNVILRISEEEASLNQSTLPTNRLLTHPDTTLHTHKHPFSPILHHQTHSLRYHPQPTQLNKVKTQTSKHKLHTNPLQSRNQHMTRTKHPLDHRKRPLTRTPLPANPHVPEPVPDTQRMTPTSPLHRSIPATRHHTARAYSPEVMAQIKGAFKDE